MVGELFALLSAFCFSTANVSVRRGMRTARDNGTFIATFVNMVLFLALIIPLYLKGLLPLLSRLGFLLFVLAGLLTTFAGRSFLYAAIRGLGPSRASPYKCGSPIITVCLAYLFLSERLSLTQFLGAMSILTGIWILSKEVVRRTDLEVVHVSRLNAHGPKGIPDVTGSSGQSSFMGILYGMLSALSFGGGHFLRKLAVIEVPSPFWGMAIGTTVAWLAMVAQALIQGETKELCRNNFNVRALPWAFIITGVLYTLGQMFIYLSIYFTAVSIAMVLASSEILITLMVSRFILGREEPLNWHVLLCGSAVCLGIILIMSK
jgi:drug/metabolite transporter (DMT)-like permease